MNRKNNIISPGIDLAIRLANKRVIYNTGYTTDCWMWIGSTNPDNYGRCRFNKIIYRVHRLIAYLCLNFDLHSKLEVLHKCDNRRCFNPTHLFIGTQSDNVIDMAQKGRHYNQLKTHCPKGHEYTSKNTSIINNKRYCRECKNV